jgi:hypothetical protein
MTQTSKSSEMSLRLMEYFLVLNRELPSISPGGRTQSFINHMLKRNSICLQAVTREECHPPRSLLLEAHTLNKDLPISREKGKCIMSMISATITVVSQENTEELLEAPPWVSQALSILQPFITLFITTMLTQLELLPWTPSNSSTTWVPIKLISTELCQLIQCTTTMISATERIETSGSRFSSEWLEFATVSKYGSVNPIEQE